MEEWIKKMPKIKGISKKMLQALYERSEKEDEQEEDYKINKEKERMKDNTSVDDITQCHYMIRTTYTNRIAKKYSKIQGVDIRTYADLNDNGKKEYNELVKEYPTDKESILDIIKKRGN